ncbi:MAG: PASTA domain-containing protein [Ruminococcaceae bacterium]|nr:PASTA domain-containing protein [Oscillospiraceae bacterium]
MAYPKQHSMIKFRARIIVGFICLMFAIVSVVLFNLQILNYEKYQSEVINQMTSETTVRANRGKIYDTNMNLLVTNTTVWRVFIDPSKIKEYDDKLLIADNLSRILEVDYNSVLEKINNNPKKRDITIKNNVEKETADLVREFIIENDLSSMIYLAIGSQRFYCYGDLASHVLGFTNVDGKGQYGLELTYDDYLTGIDGKLLTAHDAQGNDMPYKYESYISAKNGTNIVSTLDMRIQYELENQLEAAYENAGARNRVTGIVMEVDTGAVLAMATYPDFDCNNPKILNEEFQKELESSGYLPDSEEYTNLYMNLLYEMWNNKAVNDLYEPGSTFKVITSAIALEEKVVKLADRFYCPGHYKVEGYSSPIHCHKRTGHGSVTFVEGLQQSCNPTLMMLAERIGRDTFYKYFEAFGYRAKTGVDLPGESLGITHTLDGFNQVELAVYSFGQTFKVTPIQQITAISTIANGGYLVTPHILRQLVDDDGNVLYSYDDSAKRQIISTETCETLTKILADGVAGNGGAKNAYVKGYSVAAKTGTSEKRDTPDENGEFSLRVGSCVAYAPADDPVIAAIIMVDEPSIANVYGSVVAAPYISNLLSVVLPYLGIEPQYTQEELASMEIPISDYTGKTVKDAQTEIKNKGLNYEVIGSGNIVTSQIPKSGSLLSSETGKVLLYTADKEASLSVTAPDLVGRTAAAANKLAVNSGLNVNILGAQNYDTGAGAVVISQSPEAGTKMARGDIITIDVRHLDGTD